MTPPCKGCEFRRAATKDAPSCHAECEVYRQYQQERREAGDKRRSDNLAVDTLCRGIEKSKAIRHTRRKH